VICEGFIYVHIIHLISLTIKEKCNIAEFKTNSLICKVVIVPNKIKECFFKLY